MSLPNCEDYTSATLNSFYVSDLNAFASTFPNLPAPVTNRMHCIVWSDWATQPKVELSHGIRFDTSYYYWPPVWVADRPGLFTGSGMPMRFADFDGTLIDVYQATTQMTDESEQTYPYTIDTLLDGALGSEGYYGAFTANMHTDSAASDGSDAIVASAQARGVPIVSARQMLQWWDGRNASAFSNLTWNGSTLSFSIIQASDANGLAGACCRSTRRMRHSPVLHVIAARSHTPRRRSKALRMRSSPLPRDYTARVMGSIRRRQ